MKGKKFKEFPTSWKKAPQNGVISQLKLGDNQFASSNKEILPEYETFSRDNCSSLPFV